MTATTDKRRGGVSLGTRIFLITAVLIVMAVGTAVVFTLLEGNRIARSAVESALERSAAAQASLQQQYEAQLERLAATFADQALVAYLAEAMSLNDAKSIRDQLIQRQSDLGFNFAIALDPSGRVVARTDRVTAGPQNLGDRPLVKRAYERGQPAVGVWGEDNALYHAVAIPLATSFEVVGYLVAGFKIDEVWAGDLAKASGAQVALLAASPGPQVVANTAGVGSAESLTSAIRTLGGISALRGRDSFRVELGGQPWQGRLTPLLDPEGQVVGATVALASLNEELAPFRRLQLVLALVGLAAIALALLASYALSRRTLGPVRRLVASTEAAHQGDYDQRVPVERSDEVGRLARAFNDLLGNLREKRDMEAYLTDLSRTLPEPARVGGATLEPEVKRVTLLTTELRRYARAQATSDPERTLGRLSRDLQQAAQAVSRRRGRLEAVAGHRLLASFEGEGKAHRALAAATEILGAVAAPEDAFDEPAEPLVALAGGQVVAGSVVWGEGPEAAMVGLPVQKLESLLREATPGEVVLAADVHQELAAAFAEAGIDAQPQRGMFSTLQFCALGGAQAAKLSGVDLSTPSAAPTLVAERVAAAADLAPGKVLGGRFELLTVLGAGGMGVVYKARDRELGDLVALKVLKREAWEDPVQLGRLKDELRLARKITHANVLRTYDFGELDGVHFISMEYVRGVTLRYMLDSTDKLPYSAGLRVAKQLCAGLAAAHAQGVIHRDIKPDNLILDQAGNAKLMDFGIARPVVRETGHTREGWIVGTPQFMSPEQLEARPVDARADVYACGVVLFEIFTGRLPFTADTPMQIVFQHLNQEPPRPSQYWAEIPPELEGAILTCLAKKPEGRYASAERLLHALEALSA